MASEALNKFFDSRQSRPPATPSASHLLLFKAQNRNWLTFFSRVNLRIDLFQGRAARASLVGSQNDCITAQFFAHRRSADRERRSGSFCSDYDGAWNHGPKQGGFHRDMAAS